MRTERTTWSIPAAILLVLVTAVAAPTGASDRQVELIQVPAIADSLDGKRITVRGIVLMSEDSRSVVSTLDLKNQVCVGLLVTEETFLALQKFHKHRAAVTGVFEKNGCGGLRVCHDSCGPFAIVDPQTRQE